MTLWRNVSVWLVLSSVHVVFAQNGATVKGVVVNESGKSVTGAQVYVLEKRRFVGHRLLEVHETDSSGEFVASNLTWGTYMVMASKPSDGYPDTKLAFYSDLAVPTVTLSPSFPQAHVNVQLGPKAGILEVSSLENALSGKAIEYATITLRRVHKPTFFITTATKAGTRILVPSLTDVSVGVSAQGYKSWPSQDEQKKSAQFRLKPEEVYKLRIRLEPEAK